MKVIPLHKYCTFITVTGCPKKSSVKYKIYYSERVLQKDVHVTLRDMSMVNVFALYSSTLYTCMQCVYSEMILLQSEGYYVRYEHIETTLK